MCGRHDSQPRRGMDEGSRPAGSLLWRILPTLTRVVPVGPHRHPGKLGQKVPWLGRCSVYVSESDYVLSASSRSRTDFSSLIRIVVRLGNWSFGVLCAVTRADCEKHPIRRGLS